MKKIILTVPDPCHEKWEEMSPVEKGRFCNSCQKTVIDFTQMSDAQVAAFFKKPVKSICGRIHPDQLDRGISIPKKQVPWVRYFFQFSLPAFLISMKSNSQKLSCSKQITTSAIKKYKMGEPQAFSIIPSLLIEGIVVDTAGSPIPYATVSLKNSNHSTTSNEHGRFQLESDTQNPVIFVTAIGFETVERVAGTGNSQTIMMQEKVVKMEDIVIKTTYGTLHRNFVGGLIAVCNGDLVSKINQTSWVTKMADTLFSSFSIFPNPLQRNSNLTLKASGMERGEYLVSVLDEKTAIVQTSSISFQQKNQSVGMLIGNLPAGFYLVYLKNKRTGKQYTKKLIVQ